MDVDLIFKRGVTYTLATATVVGLYFLLISIAGDIVQKRLPSFRLGRIHHRHHPRRAALRPAQARHPGAHRQALRPQALRLPPDADRVRPRTQLADRSRRLAHVPSSTGSRRPCSVAQVAVFLSDDQGGYTLAAAHGLPQPLRINGKNSTPRVSPAPTILVSSTWVFSISTSPAPARISFSKIPSTRCTCPRPSSAPSPRSI